MMIPILEIPLRELRDKPLYYFAHNNYDGELQKIWQQLKKATGYSFDNNKVLWSDGFGNLISLAIHYNAIRKVFELSIWDYRGTTSLGGFKVTVANHLTDTLFRDDYEKICKLSEDFYYNGFIHCSECNKEMSYQQNKTHKYFAGIYCTDCWEKKYRAIEAAENYE